MNLSELSRRSGRSIATIKFYIREGLVAPGQLASPKRADYDDEHLRRLQLVTTLVEVGALPIASVRAVCKALDDHDMAMHEVLGVAHRALAPQDDKRERSSHPSEVSREIDDFIDALGWTVKPDAAGRRQLADALASLRELGWDVTTDVFSRYAALAGELAEWELQQTPDDGPRDQIVEAMVVGTVVFESVLVALRRLAEEHHSSRR